MSSDLVGGRFVRGERSSADQETNEADATTVEPPAAAASASAAASEPLKRTPGGPPLEPEDDDKKPEDETKQLLLWDFGGGVGILRENDDAEPRRSYLLSSAAAFATLERVDAASEEIKKLWEFGIMSNNKWQLLVDKNEGNGDYTARCSVVASSLWSSSKATPPHGSGVIAAMTSGIAGARAEILTIHTMTSFGSSKSTLAASMMTSARVPRALVPSKVGPAPPEGGGSSSAAAPPPGSDTGTGLQPPAANTSSVAAFGWVEALVHKGPFIVAKDLFDDKCDCFLSWRLAVQSRKSPSSTQRCRKGTPTASCP